MLERKGLPRKGWNPVHKWCGPVQGAIVYGDRMQVRGMEADGKGLEM